MSTSHVGVHIEVAGSAVDNLVAELHSGRIAVRIKNADHLDVWVQGTPGELNDWALAILGAILGVTKIASSPGNAASTEASPPPVSPTPAAGQTYQTAFDHIRRIEGGGL